MGKKYKTTQELANSYPPWSRVRSDEQSVGQSLLNVIAKNFDLLDTELYRANSNLYLSTANVGEIDLTYIFDLPRSFEFEFDNLTQLDPLPLSPTVSGLIGDTWYLLDEVDSGSVVDFWYQAVPSRLSLEATVTGVTPLLLETSSEVVTVSGLSDFDMANSLHVNVVGAALLEEATNPNGYLQAKVRITGTTWKDTFEIEELPYIYSQTKRTNKVWKQVDTIEPIDFPASGTITIHTHGFNLGLYSDPFFNISQFEHNRDNLPTFWTLEDSTWSASGIKLLVNKTYAAVDPIDIVRGNTDLMDYREWELLDTGGSPIQPIDIAPIPYSDRVWAITTTGLYLYDLDWEQPDFKLLAGKNSSPVCKIVTNRDYVTREEELEVELLFARPIKTLIKHRLTIQYPDGISFGVDEDQNLVSTTSDYWVYSTGEARDLRHPVFFEFIEYGDHLLTLECIFTDGSCEIDKRLVRVGSKTALAQFDLSPYLTTASGVDINHLQELLIMDTNNDVHQLNLHYDNMLIDFNNKQLIFREPYEQVKVIK